MSRWHGHIFWYQIEATLLRHYALVGWLRVKALWPWMGYVITSTFNQRNLGPFILLGVMQLIHCVKGSFSDLDHFEEKKTTCELVQ